MSKSLFSNVWIKTLSIACVALCMALPSGKAYAQGGESVTLKMRGNLEQVLMAVERQSGHVFLNDNVDLRKTVSADVQGQSLTAALDEILAGTGVYYRVSGGNVVISTEPLSEQKAAELVKKLAPVSSTAATQAASQPAQREEPKPETQPQQPQGRQGQARTISGTLVDEFGEPVIGGAVLLKGTTIGASTDIDGRFSFDVPAGSEDRILEFSSLGYATVEEPLNGRSIFNVTLGEDSEMLEATVVTALGIKRAERSVTYNVQKVSDDAFKVREANMVNSLQGKLAGVQINTTAAGAGSESKVVMRGAKSIANTNNALYVLDGIPLPSLSRTEPGDSWSIYGGATLTGDGISNFNPEDIAETSALVGPSAAALYGYRAQNGILMLTSRGGEEGFSVSYANNTSFSSPFMLPQLQRTYGNTAGSYLSWGSKLTGEPSWSIRDFFQTGYNTQNSLSVSYGKENMTTYVSASMTDSEGIIPNNLYNRKNLTFKHTADLLNEKLHFSILAMYAEIAEQNQLAGGEYYNPLVPLYLMSPADDLSKYQTYERYNTERGFMTQYWPSYASDFSMQNPFWVINRNLRTADKKRFLLGGSIGYDITDWLDVQVRGRMDNNTTLSEMKNYASTNGLFAGYFGRYYSDIYRTQVTYADALLNVHKQFADNIWQINATVGASVETNIDRVNYTRGDLLKVANLFTMNNMDTSKGLSRTSINDQTQSVFGTFQLGFRNWLFLDLTARNDWDSRMTDADGNVKSIFYPSVGLSAILTDAFNVHSDFLSFAKVRASYAEVGNAPMRFITGPKYYDVSSGGVTSSTTWGISEDFEPERTKSFEAGLDLRLFSGKLTFAGTYYQSQTYNQVFTPEVSGLETLYINAGRVDNKGIELSLGFTQDLGQVRWNSNLIYSRNINKIVKMLDNVEFEGKLYNSTALSVGGSNGARMWLTEGGAIGDLYVSRLLTDEHGYIFVSNAESGNIVVPAENKGTLETMMYAGNVNPSWTGSWRNAFSWKGLTASAMVTARVGGVGVSLTEAALDTYGMSKRTEEARDNGGALVNGVRIPAQPFYTTIGGQANNAIGSFYTYSMTNVRLSEVSLGYDIPVNNWLSWIKGLNVSVVGRNLLMLYCKAPFDPEVISGAGNYSAGIDYFMVPSTRNLGFSAKITF